MVLTRKLSFYSDSTLALQQLKQQLQVLEAEGRDLKMLIDGLRRQSQQLKVCIIYYAILINLYLVLTLVSSPFLEQSS